ncbi:MAG: PASTA domain-containing protein [Ruminococcaceae bacterium]|nr:PASTA domain-containing protein [Oscillospiraceae bacterium]
MEKERLRKISLSGNVLIIIMLLIALGISVKLFSMQVNEYEYYQNKIINNVQQEYTISAERGTIYDTNMTPVAINVTTYRIFLDPVAIQNGSSAGGAEETAALIADNLSELLGVDRETIYKRALRKGSKDETVARKASEETATAVRTFISKYGLSRKIYLEATPVRYYPYDGVAANVIGVMGTDKGLLGIELSYNSYLEGTPGRYIVTRNAQSAEMPDDYDYYIDAKDGLSAVLTIDMNIQRMLEKQLKDAFTNAKGGEPAVGLVMNVKTGAVLAMGQYPSFNINSPYSLGDTLFADRLESSGYESGTPEYNEELWTQIYSMWNNKAVSYLYEPGSTMKVMSAAAALEEGVVSFSDTFTCRGNLVVANTKINCHNIYGHGTRNYAYMLQASCNPTMMQVAARVGETKYYEYFTNYGYTSKTGIDLPGESAGLYVSKSGFNAVELACYSFGQTFKTTPLQQVTAFSAVANGGYVVQPYIVKSLIDSDGNEVVTHETTVKRRVLSSRTCEALLEVLEQGVSGGGGAKNAYVAGYKIAAKTGTSEKRDKINPETGKKDYRIGSCMAIAPADEPEIAVLIMVDEPGVRNKYGSTIAAPYMSALLSELLPYLGVERNYSSDEMNRMVISVANYKGTSVQNAAAALNKLGLSYEVVGDGDTVTSQIPSAGTKMTKINGKVILYTGGATNTQYVTVPDLVDQKAANAIKQLAALGLNVYIDGSANYDEGAGAEVVSQSHEAGTRIQRGAVITIKCQHMDGTD